jgi:transposase
VARARAGDDYARDKTDHRDAYLIGKLAVRPECYLPERAEEARARLRHLGARRFALVADVVACRAQIGDAQDLAEGRGCLRSASRGRSSRLCSLVEKARRPS